MNKYWKSLIITVLAVTLVFSFVLAKSGKYAWLGISTQTVDSELAKAFDLAVDYGTIVNEIAEDSPAEKAGIKEGDIIIAYDKTKIHDYDDLIDFLEDSKPDDKVMISLNREGKVLDLEVTLGETPSDRNHNRFFNRNNPRSYGVPSVPKVPHAPKSLDNFYSYQVGAESYIGVQLTDLSDQLRNYFGINDNIGVLVSEVETGTPADKAGIKAGDVIIAAGDEDVYNYRDLKNVIEDLDEGDILDLKIVRNKKQSSIAVTVAERENDNLVFFNGPDLNIQIPHFDKNHSFFSDDLNEFFNSDEFREEMDRLKEELSQLRFHLKDDFDSKEYKDEMRQLKKELEKNKKELNKELKKEMEDLKKELQRLEKKIDD